MIKFTALYPNKEGSRFDLTYYKEKHVPMVMKMLGDLCLRGEIEHGLSGGAPGSQPKYVVIAHLYFDSMETFQKAFLPHAEEMGKDTPNYTDVQPIIQMSEVI